MKRNISYILGFIAVAMLASCMKVDIHPVQVDDTAMVSLTLKSTEPVATRADGDAVTELNENLISSVQCFFSNDGENILFSARKENLNDADGTVDNLNLEISSADLAKLNSTCHVFAVVNCAELSIPEDKTIATLKSSTEIALSKSDNTTQTSFVMVGAANNLIKADNKLSGTVKVKRVAAKVNVILKVAESIEVKNGDQTETWLPYFNADGDEDSKISLTFSGKAKTVLADADIVAETQNPSFNSTDDFDVTATAFDGLVTPADNVYTVTMQVPFYTYPMSWEGQNNIILRLPWKLDAADGTTEVRYATYEYQIPVQYDNKKLLSNNEYELTVNVGILGNLGTTVLIPSYQVANWGTGEINAELSRPKYLVVEKGNHVVDGVTYHYVMNNTTELTIPFHSSDDCAISISCKQTNLSTGNVKNVDRNDNATSVTNKSFKAVLNNEAKTVTITHGVNNDLYDSTDDTNGVFDFTPYIYVLTITHDGDASFKETINIIQYPAIYGYGDENSDYKEDGDGQNIHYGYVWINGYYGEEQIPNTYYTNYPEYTLNNQTISNFGESGGLNSSDLTAKDMYVISVSSVQGTDYVIGDPRTRTPQNSWKWGTNDDDNTYDTNWYTAPHIDGTNHNGPQYYYPTDANLTGPDNNPTYNMIAPKFRVCSAYGAISDSQDYRKSYNNVKGRCASYQEDGYPAGRWRLPTKAEFELINVLSNKGLLPTLYVTTMNYWSAHGYGRYSSGEVELIHNDPYSSESISVRCVYDDWYWGSEPVLENKSQFTWGDEQREN